MKKILIIIFAISVLISAQDLKRYQFKSGKIVYQVSMLETETSYSEDDANDTESNNLSNSMVGTETLSFDNYGMNEVKHTKMVMGNDEMQQVIDAKTIMEGKWIYTIDNSTNTGNKMENPLWEMIPKGTELQNIGEEIMTVFGGKKIGTEVLLGKTCDIWQVEQSKIWMWKSIPLKAEVDEAGTKIAQIATSVEVDIPISADEFKLPEGIEIQEINAADLNGMMGN